MKPFNLEKAKAGKPVCTRDGRNVRILSFNLKSTSRPIVAAVQHEAGKEDEYITTYTVYGHHFCNRVNEDDDLMMKCERKQGWMPIAWFGENKRGLLIFDTKEEAEAYYKDDEDNCIVDIIPIEWEE